jgi:hypothetical protein
MKVSATLGFAVSAIIFVALLTIIAFFMVLRNPIESTVTLATNPKEFVRGAAQFALLPFTQPFA